MRLLYSTRRNVLTDHCLQEICARIGANPMSRSILVVPEQTKMDMEQALFSHCGRGCLMFTEVLSFRRLAWRLLGEAGLQPSAVIDPVGQAMLIHRVLRQNQANLHTFGHLADKPGFIREAAAVLGDLKRYRIGAADLRAVSSAAEDRGLQNKAGDLSVLLENYDQALKDAGLADAEDDLNRLAGLLEKQAAGGPASREPGGMLRASGESSAAWPENNLSWLRETAFWVCGFAETRDFTPQEDAILAALDKMSESLTLTAAADAIPFDAQSVDDGADCFLNGRRAALRLIRRYPGCRVERLPGTFGGLTARIAGHMRNTSIESDGTAGITLRLVQANGQDDELMWAAGEIRRLVREEGYRYRDIALALCDLPGMSPRLRAVFREQGIPLFLDAEKPLNGTPLARLTLGLLDIGIYGWVRNAVMACLRSGLSPLAPSEIDQLENVWLAKGLFRRGRIFDDSQYENKDLLLKRDIALQPVRSFLSRLKKEAAGKDKCRLLNAFLNECGVPGRIRDRSAELMEAREGEPAVALVQSWNELDRIMEQMSRLSGDLPLSLQTFRDTLAAGMDSASGGVIPTAIDQVAAGSLKRAMLRPCRALFLIGASAGRLPPPLPPEGLLKDQDRQSLSLTLGRQLPSSVRDQVFADAFVQYSLMTLPASRLYMTSPEAVAAPLFNELAGLEPGAVLYLPDPSRRPAGEFAETPGKGGEVRLDAELIRMLYPGDMTLSVTQLEKYAACPFLHLASGILFLEEREIWQPQAADAGTLLHGAAELALTDLKNDLACLDPTDADGRKRVVQAWLDGDLAGRSRAWMEEAARRGGLEKFFEAGLNASAGRRAIRQFTASLQAILHQYRDTAYRPSSLEWTFGIDPKSSLAIRMPDRPTLFLRGKIDRVDEMDDEGCGQFRIIDYKSGDKSPDYDGLYHGLSLQLPIYLSAYKASHPDRQARDAAYFRFDRPILRLDGRRRPDPLELAEKIDKCFALRGLQFPPDELSFICRHALRQAAKLAENIFGGDFGVLPRRMPGRQPACSYCPMMAVCGFDQKPSGYRALPPLRCRPGDAGKPVRKRRELILRLQEEESQTGGGDHAAHT